MPINHYKDYALHEPTNKCIELLLLFSFSDHGSLPNKHDQHHLLDFSKVLDD